jgi:hypothetical protein
MDKSDFFSNLLLWDIWKILEILRILIVKEKNCWIDMDANKVGKRIFFVVLGFEFRAYALSLSSGPFL